MQREVWHLSLRAAQGALRALGAALGFEAPDFTTLWKRLSKEEAEPVVQPRSAIVAVDSTGFSTTVRGEWLRAQWRKRRSFVKERMVVDVETLDILCVIVTDDTVRDAKAFAELVQQVLD